MLDDAELSVEVLAPDTLAYSLTSGGRHELSIVPDALAASCYDDLLSVQLVACNGSLPAVAPPLELDLPSPVALRALGLSAEVLAPSGSFARSGALSSRPSTSGTISSAFVQMSEGSDKDMRGDARVTLTSSEPDCVATAADLTASTHFWAVEGGGCTSVSLTATFTLGA